jgi:molybdopterin-guanine dinucleotide biosynthesis protein A
VKYKRIDHKKWKYELEEDFYYEFKSERFNQFFDVEYILMRNNSITIKKGYAWDGLTSWPDTKRNLRAALVHDALLQAQDLLLVHKDLTNDIHRVFRDMLPNRAEAWILYLGIRAFYPIRQWRKRVFK